MAGGFFMAENMQSWVDGINFEQAKDLSKALREHISFDSTETGFYFLLVKTGIKDTFGVTEINSFLKKDIEKLVAERITALINRMNDEQKKAVMETITEKLNKMKILQNGEAIKKKVTERVREILGIKEQKK